MNVDEFLQQELTRRRFLEQSAAGAVAGWAGLPLAGPLFPDQTPPRAERDSASSRVRVGVIGLGRQGQELALTLAGLANVQLAAICDIESSRREQLLRKLSRLQATTPRVLSDPQRLLDRTQLDAVVIATPDHLHVPLAVAACRSGRDVYLEAPVTHSRQEAANLLTASQGRVVQCGLQQRSGAHFQSAIALLQRGGIGRIGHVRAWAVQRRADDRDCTAACDGHAAAQWRWKWQTGAGVLGTLGVHLLDVARWGLGVGLPERVTAQGHRLTSNASDETPDTLCVQYEYPQVTMAWEHRLWSPFGNEGRSAGIAFHGTDGTLIVDRGGWKVYGREQGAVAAASPLLRPHLQNFVDCIRTRMPPAADLITGCLSSELCHLGHTAYREGGVWTRAATLPSSQQIT